MDDAFEIELKTNEVSQPDSSGAGEQGQPRRSVHLTCYRIRENPPVLSPGRSDRAWMDAAGQRFPYRCTPLTIANATGWDILCPVGLTARWNGGAQIADLVVELDDGSQPTQGAFAQSHFGFGVLSFHPGYLFRTDPGWGVWCRGAPNYPKDGLLALDGLVETDWLPFSFTMNWLFTRPGTVRFEKGEPFCFILPVPHAELETIEPQILPLSANPELSAEHAAWSTARADFNKGLATRDPGVIKERWQRFYLNGKSPNGLTAPETHRTKRKMKPAVVGSTVPPAAPPRAAPRAEPARPTKLTAPPQPKAAVAAATPGHGQPVAQNIIWLASYPKSGNTWIRALLHNLHLEPNAGAADINRLNEFTAWETPAAPYSRLLRKSTGEASQEEIARIRPRIQAELAAGRPQPFLVKTHLCLGREFETPTINLDATRAAIYIVRNPLDVVISYAHHSGISIDAMIANLAMPGMATPGSGRSVHEVLGSWSEHVASWIGLNSRPVLILRYEDFIANPMRPLATLARFLGLAPTDDQLKGAIAKSSFAEMRRQELENGFKERPPTAKLFFREGRAGQWRDVLTPDQVSRIIRDHEPMMQRFGYLPQSAGLRLSPLSR